MLLFGIPVFGALFIVGVFNPGLFGIQGMYSENMNEMYTGIVLISIFAEFE